MHLTADENEKITRKNKNKKKNQKKSTSNASFFLIFKFLNLLSDGARKHVSCLLLLYTFFGFSSLWLFFIVRAFVFLVAPSATSWQKKEKGYDEAFMITFWCFTVYSCQVVPLPCQNYIILWISFPHSLLLTPLTSLCSSDFVVAFSCVHFRSDLVHWFA